MKHHPMLHHFTSDQQFTSYKILNLLFPMMITIHQRNRNVSNDDDTFSKSTQNSLPWVLPDKYITDQLTIQLIPSLLALFSLFLPSTKQVTVRKSNFLQFINEQNFPYSTPPFSKFPVTSTSPFSAESGQHPNRKVPRFTNKVLEWYKHLFQIHNVP